MTSRPTLIATSTAYFTPKRASHDKSYVSIFYGQFTLLSIATNSDNKARFDSELRPLFQNYPRLKNAPAAKNLHSQFDADSYVNPSQKQFGQMQVALPPCKFTVLFNGTIPDNTSPLVSKLHPFFRHYLRLKKDQISTFFPIFRHFSPRTIQLAEMRKISARPQFHQLSNATNRVSLSFIVPELRPPSCKCVTAFQSQP